MIESGEFQRSLARAARIAPTTIWQVVAERLERGEWRLEMTLRGWFTEVVPLAVLTEWIGESVERAKLVACIAHAGEEHPSPIARLLLDRFGTVAEVGSSLAGEYYSGSWVGHWSERLGLLIKQLRQWEQDLSLPVGVRRWATQFTSDLERQRVAEIEREQERFRE